MICFTFVVALLFVVSTFGQKFLHTDGTRIVDVDNRNVVFHGLNLGGWSLQEGYMLNPAGSSNVGTQWQMKKQYYNEGVSDDNVEKFYASWRDNFVTKADIDYIASLGFNAIRLPLHYELFLTRSQRSYRNAVIHNTDNYGAYLGNLSQWVNNNQIAVDNNLDAYTIINNMLNWCSQHGIWLILDMHAAPGGQGSDVNIGDILFANNLWENAWVFEEVLVKIWQNVARRYKADGRIGFYDLLNEPNNVPGGGQKIHDLLQRIITTVRNEGDNHMLMVEGNDWGNQYNYLEPFTFTPSNWGLIYNAHRYWTSTSTTTTDPNDPNHINEIGNILAFSSKYQVPVVVGETGENSAQWMADNIAAMESVNLGWFHWTYKRFDVSENAAIMRISGAWPTDGAAVMDQVLKNIQHQYNVPNWDTINAVAPNFYRKRLNITAESK